VVKLLAWLNKKSTRVVTHEEYMKVYQQIIYQCDTEDNNERVYDIFEEFVTEYLDQHVMSRLRREHDLQLLVNAVDRWDAYTLYSKMMEKSFEYLNRYYLRNN
jgi:uncharacterized protein (DUF2336 family)